MRKKICCLSSSTLKIIAMAVMLLDHIWGTVGGPQWLTIVGRIAFPIFAYQIAEGYSKTSNYRKYILRMFIFALVSEIPFNYMMGGELFDPFDQNVMFTFLIALLLIRVIDKVKGRLFKEGNAKTVLRYALYVSFLVIICFIGYVLGIVCFVDYHGDGVLVVLAFYIFKDVRIKNINIGPVLQFIAVAYIFAKMIRGIGTDITIAGFDFFVPYQTFGLFAFVPIWLYNGEKGIKGKWFRYLGYAFYPVHIAILVTAALLIK